MYIYKYAYKFKKMIATKKIRMEVGCVVWGSVLLRAWVV